MNIKKSKRNFKAALKPFLALVLAIITVIGTVPSEVLANQLSSSKPPPLPPPRIEVETSPLQPFYANINGEEVEIPANGILMMPVESISEPLVVEIPRFIYLEGERLYMNDERVLNVSPVVPTVTPFGSTPMPQADSIIALAGIPVGNVVNIPPDYTFDGRRLQMNNTLIQERRYAVRVNGVLYEAYCADPQLPGPANANAAYIMTGIEAERFRTVLRYGHPSNPYINTGDLDRRIWGSYMTRVAVAAANVTDATWRYEAGGGIITAETRATLDQFIAGTVGSTPGSFANYPPITVNDQSEATATGSASTSPAFALGNNRRTFCESNPFRFEWATGTPAGTTLIVDGQHVATAPQNPTQIFANYIPTYDFHPDAIQINNFHFVMPAGSEGQTARVNMLGINNQYANRVYVMQNSNNPGAWQDIVFYIPEIRASAAYLWSEVPSDEYGRLRIIKTDMQGNNLAGAVFTIDGPDPSMPMTVTVPANGWTSGPLQVGSYSITEITPPPGFRLASNPTQTVVVTAQNQASATFTNASIYSGFFELPVIGATGWAARIQALPLRSEANASANTIQSLSAGTAFTILEQQGDWWYVRLGNGSITGWIQHRYAFVNLPDIIPSIINSITNASSSVKRSSGYAIPNVTGQSLYSARTFNARLGREEYIVPILFATAIPLMNAQQAALADGYTIVMYEAFRPAETQQRVVDNMEALRLSNSTINAGINTPPWSLGWFISTGVSNHQRGVAVDVALSRIDNQATRVSGCYSFVQITNHTPLVMPTEMHELSLRSAVFQGSPPASTNDTAWRSSTLAPTMTPGAVKLQNILTEAGFTPLASEWWHFNHLPSRTLIDGSINGQFLTPTIHSEVPQTETTCPPCDSGYNGNGINGSNGSNEPNIPGITIVTFRNERTTTNGGYNGVTLQKVCAITGNTVPGAVFTLRGECEATVGINVTQVLAAGATVATIGDGITSTVTGGVWRIDGLPIGYYSVTEIQAPDGFSLLPHPTTQTFTKTANSNHIMLTFRNYPFGRLEILKVEGANGIAGNRPLPDATFRLEGFYPGPPVRPLVRYAQTDSQGRIVFDNLPVGQFTLTEIMPPSGYTFGSVSTWSVSVGWGQAVEIIVYNVPKSSLEVLKICGVTHAPLADAIFELEDPTTGERWQATSGSSGIAVFGRGTHGNYLYPNRTYILREILAPAGFVLVDGPREVVLSPGDENRVTWRNWENPGLTIIKICQDTNERLAGAHFTIEAQGSGRPLPTDFPLITNENGEIVIHWTLFEGETERNFVVTETVPPPGFHLAYPNWQIITLQAGYDHTVVFANRRMPTLTIYKTDSELDTPIQGAEFTIERISPAPTGMITNNPFRTDTDGKIVLENLPAGIYRIIETRAANGYYLNSNVTNRTWIVTLRENEDYLLQVQNTLLPTLVITKMCAIANRPVPLTHFRVEFELPNSSNVSLIGNFVTNSNGQVIIPNLQPGWYRITETRAGPGMSLPSSPVTRIFLSPGQNTYRLLQQDILRRESTPNSNIIVALNNNTPAEMPEDSLEVDDITRNLVVSDGNDHLTGEYIWNFPLNSIVIRKVCSVTGNLVPGATFEVAHLSAGSTNIGGMVIGRHTTGPSGILVLSGLVPGTYLVTEVSPPRYFTLATNNAQTVHLMPDGHSVVQMAFYNDPYGSLKITKSCDATREALAGAIFRVTNASGAVIGTTFTTNANGYVLIPNLPPGAFTVVEIAPPPGFVLNSTPQTIMVNATGQVYRVEFTNPRIPSAAIRKISGDDDRPLAGVVFEITSTRGERIQNPRDGTFEFTTDSAGMIFLPNLQPGTFIARETRPLPGYRPAEPYTFTIREGEEITLTIRNYKRPSVVIRKICGETGRPLPGVDFEIVRYFSNGQTGQRVKNKVADGSYTFTTDFSGHIYLPTLEDGVFMAIETRALPGFMIGSPTIFTVGKNGDTTIIVRNYRYPDFVIRKTDGDTGQVLAGVHFEIARFVGNASGGERLLNPVDNSTTFITDNAGLIHLPAMEPGIWVAIETRPLPGYIIAEPTIFIVGEGTQNKTIDIRNFRSPNLTIRKISSETRQPIQGVVFQIARVNGERIQNPQTGFFDFVTDRNGLIHLPAIEDGTFLVTEIRAAEGYFGLDEAVVLQINSQTRQQDYLLVIENVPASGLRIIKTDAHTNQPLQGVEFDIRHADGRRVQGLIADQNQPGTPMNSPQLGPNGGFLTDHRGWIQINQMPAGVFHITEIAALPGYILDTTVHVVTITPGRLTTLEVTNVQKAGLRLYKIDSVTRIGIPGVEFRIFDFITRQEVAGPFVTDSNGVIDFTGILPAGRYTIQETRAAQGYLIDNMPRTIEFRAGMMTEIVWENTREAGQIQITKLSSADNEINGLSRGSRLEGAVFEVRDWRTGNVVDQFITDHRGVGASRPLPLGRYLIEEIVSPAFYRRSDQVLDVTIEHSGQIVRKTFYNEPANVGVEIRKTGPVEVMAGQPIIWNITTIANSSTIPLSDFYVRDILPAHAVRLDRIFTGTFNQALRYSIMFRTNRSDQWRVAYDNLQTTTNNALVMSPAALGLGSGEFATEIMFQFGTVHAGFRAVENPRLEGTVLDGLPNGYEFANRVDIGGRTGSEWVIGNNVWTTRVFRPAGRHPRTGF